MSVVSETVDGVAILTFTNPPVNALSAGVRRGIFDAVKIADSNLSIRGIVLIGGGTTFPAGADITEFSGAALNTGPMLNEVSPPPICNFTVCAAGLFVFHDLFLFFKHRSARLSKHAASLWSRPSMELRLAGGLRLR